MNRITLIALATVLAVALAEGQYYVPRAYYTIDAEGHASAPVPLRRLRRSPSYNPVPLPYYNPGASASASASANANAGGWGDGSASADARANANAVSGAGSWGMPQPGGYGASNPYALRAGEYRRVSGPVDGGKSVLASSSVGLDSTGQGYYDQYTAVGN